MKGSKSLLTLGLALAFAAITFSPAMRAKAQTVTTLANFNGTVLILGNGLTGSTSVTFNGVEADFTVESDTYINATVPAGAETGVVSVVTPSATLNSNPQFVVTK